MVCRKGDYGGSITAVGAVKSFSFAEAGLQLQ